MYVANYSAGTISIFSVNSGDGSLTADATAAVTQGPLWLNVDPDNKYLLSCSDATDAISVFSINGSSLEEKATLLSINNPRSSVIIPFN